MKQKYKFLIYLIPLLCFLPIYLLRDFTPNNELRYVSIIDEALNKGSVVVFYNHGIPYADKPPLYFWIMMLGRIIAGKHLLAFMGVFNLMVVGGIMAVMNKWCFPNGNMRTLLPPMLTLLTTGLFTGSFLVMRMDILMTLFIVLSLYTFYKIYQGKGSKDDEWIFPLYLFLAIFSKGPVGLAIPVISIIVFLTINKQLRKIGQYLGFRTWGILLGLCAIWFGAVWLEGGIDYLNNLLFHQTIDRAVNSFHHKQPFYFYILRFWLLAAPWSLFVGVTMIRSVRKKLITDYPIRRFFVVIIATTFLFLSFISSKVDIYLLPAYPFFIYFAFLVADDIKESKWVKAMIWIPVILLCCSLPIALYIEQQLPFELSSSVLLITGAIVLTLSAIFAVKALSRNKITDAVGFCGSGIILFLLLNAFQIPSFNNYIGLRGAANTGMQLGKIHKTMRYASYGIGRTENMDVYLKLPVIGFKKWDSIFTEEVVRKPFILFTTSREVSRNDSLRILLQGRENRIVGKYEIYTIE